MEVTDWRYNNMSSGDILQYSWEYESTFVDYCTVKLSNGYTLKIYRQELERLLSIGDLKKGVA